MDDLYTGMQDELAELRRVAPARIRIHDRSLTGRNPALDYFF